MVLGAIGVAMAMHAHLEQRMDVLAILKAVGAGSSDLLRIFLLQTLGLGLAGGLLGVAAGVAVMESLPAVFGNLLPVHTVLAFPWRSIGAGLGTGLLTTLLFCLPPLLDVRAVRPVLVLRRLVESGPDAIAGFFARIWARRLQLSLAIVVVAGLGGIAWALSDSPGRGTGSRHVLPPRSWFFSHSPPLPCGSCAFSLIASACACPASCAMAWPTSIAPATSPRPCSPHSAPASCSSSPSTSCRPAILSDIKQTASPKVPNMFLIDITTEESAPLADFFDHLPGVIEPLDLMPSVRGSITALNGKTLDQLKDQHLPRRMLEEGDLTWADAPPTGDKIVQGKWWSNPNAQQIAVGEGFAQRLHLGIGSSVELETQVTGAHKLTVAAIFRADEQHLGGRAPFVLPSGVLKGEVATWYGGAHVDPAQVAGIERSLFASYPTVTVINLADVIQRIESVIDQVTFVIHFLAGFSIFAGLTILASSIASTRFRRMREAVVLKTLGATRMRIVRTFSVEFSVLGLLAGLVGVIFANLLTRVLLHRLETAFHIQWTATVVALVGTAILATATGWIASYRILGLRPAGSPPRGVINRQATFFTLCRSNGIRHGALSATIFSSRSGYSY